MARRTEERRRLAERLVAKWREGNNSNMTDARRVYRNSIVAELSQLDGATGARVALEMHRQMTDRERDELIENL